MPSKVGIVTFHDGLNYGASLQAIATCKALRDTHSIDAEVVKYTPIKAFIKETLYYLLKRDHPTTGAKKMYKFYNYKSAYFSRRYLSQKRLNKYNALIFGADEIWNTKNNSFDFNSLYLGAGINAKKYSMCPSVGSGDSIEGPYINSFQTELSSFKAISVRDPVTKDALKKIGIESQLSVDPVFLPVEFDDLQPKINLPKDYIVVYASPKHINIDQLIERLRQKHNKKIVALGWPCKSADFDCSNAGIGEWIWIFKNSSLVYTTMFHGICFSAKYSKPFSALSTDYRKNKLTSFERFPDLWKSIHSCEEDFINAEIDSALDRVNISQKLEAIASETLNQIAQDLK